MQRRLITGPTLILILWSSLVSAQDHTRDGVLLRMATGVGGIVDDAQAASVDSLAVGWMVATGFAIQLELWGDSVAAYGFGGGATYYLMPHNLFWSASWGMSGSYDDTSVVGWGAAHLVGKEWWVSSNWSLGVAGQFLYADHGDEEAASLGVLFSATYN